MCPGCGARLPATGGTLDPRLTASPECQRVYGEVIGFELIRPVPAGRSHQLTVDAYGAQHADGDTSYIRLAYSLVGLYLALERGMRGVDVRAAHQRMGRPDPSWPWFSRPDRPEWSTVVDVAEAGVRLDSIEGHSAGVHRWATEVWHAWAGQHAAVARLAARLFPGGA